MQLICDLLMRPMTWTHFKVWKQTELLANDKALTYNGSSDWTEATAEAELTDWLYIRAVAVNMLQEMLNYFSGENSGV